MSHAQEAIADPEAPIAWVQLMQCKLYKNMKRQTEQKFGRINPLRGQALLLSWDGRPGETSRLPPVRALDGQLRQHRRSRQTESP